jgi:hypothetical protein
MDISSDAATRQGPFAGRAAANCWRLNRQSAVACAAGISRVYGRQKKAITWTVMA